MGAMMEVPAPRPRVRLTKVARIAVPTECRHCDAPACLAACPSGAIVKGGPGFPVLLLEQRCVGCRSCIVACPYGAIELDERNNTPYKCDLCVSRLNAGKVPACVEACPTGCLSFNKERKVRTWLDAMEQGQVPGLMASGGRTNG